MHKTHPKTHLSHKFTRARTFAIFSTMAPQAKRVQPRSVRSNSSRTPSPVDAPAAPSLVAAVGHESAATAARAPLPPLDDPRYAWITCTPKFAERVASARATETPWLDRVRRAFRGVPLINRVPCDHANGTDLVHTIWFWNMTDIPAATLRVLTCVSEPVPRPMLDLIHTLVRAVAPETMQPLEKWSQCEPMTTAETETMVTTAYLVKSVADWHYHRETALVDYPMRGIIDTGIPLLSFAVSTHNPWLFYRAATAYGNVCTRLQCEDIVRTDNVACLRALVLVGLHARVMPLSDLAFVAATYGSMRCLDFVHRHLHPLDQLADVSSVAVQHGQTRVVAYLIQHQIPMRSDLAEFAAKIGQWRSIHAMLQQSYRVDFFRAMNSAVAANQAHVVRYLLAYLERSLVKSTRFNTPEQIVKRNNIWTAMLFKAVPMLIPDEVTPAWEEEIVNMVVGCK